LNIHKLLAAVSQLLDEFLLPDKEIGGFFNRVCRPSLHPFLCLCAVHASAGR
jgi:hypothetical protein